MARAQALLEEPHVRLLTAYPADAVIHATAIAELALGETSGAPADARADLGALVDELQRTRRTEVPVQALVEARVASPAAEGRSPARSGSSATPTLRERDRDPARAERRVGHDTAGSRLRDRGDAAGANEVIEVQANAAPGSATPPRPARAA